MLRSSSGASFIQHADQRRLVRRRDQRQRGSACSPPEEATASPASCGGDGDPRGRFQRILVFDELQLAVPPPKAR
jgi:hypothetical protein